MIPDHLYFDKPWTLKIEAKNLDRKDIPRFYLALEQSWRGVIGAWGLKPTVTFPQYPANGVSVEDRWWTKSLSKVFKVRCKAEVNCFEWVDAPSILVSILFLSGSMGLSDLYFQCLQKLMSAMPVTLIKCISPATRSRDSNNFSTRMEFFDPWQIIRIHPVVFYSRVLCQTAFNLSPEEVHDRMKPHCQDIRLIADGVLALVTDQELSAQASDEMSNRILVALGRSPVEYDDTPYRQKTP